MAFSTLTIYLTNTSSRTLTLTTADAKDAKQFVQNIVKNGCVFDDNGIWYPSSAIQQIVIS
jgi:hypothetical protein